MSIDLKSLSIDPDNQTAELTLIHPVEKEPLTDDNGNEAVIILHGPDSTQRKSHSFKQFNQRTKKNGASFNFTAEEAEEIRLSRCIVATHDWKNIGFDGESLDCTTENKRKIFKAAPWIMEQIESFIDDRANFMNG